MELIRLENITKTYHLGEIDVPVLKGISLTIRRGEMVALMGASGSGKTTLMNILGCLDRPSSGEFWLDGEEMSQLTPNQRALVRTAKLGFVFQSFNLLPRTTALHQVIMPLDYSPNRRGTGVALSRARALLARVGLADRADHEPSQMSGGQQQRTAIARSLVNQPALVLADEPTGNLDSHTSVEILRMFQQLNAEGITVILVTHDPKVATYAHRTIRIADGLIEGDETRVPETAGGPVLTPAMMLDHGGNGNGGNGNGNGELHPSEHVRVGLASLAGSVSTAGVPGPPAASPAQEAASAVAVAEPAIVITPERQSANPAPKPAASLFGDGEKVVQHFSLPALLPTTWRTAFGALRRNKMRSALTALGVIIGVAAVIAMTGIGQGSKRGHQEDYRQHGRRQSAHISRRRGQRRRQLRRRQPAHAHARRRRADRRAVSVRRGRGPYRAGAGPVGLWPQQLEHPQRGGHVSLVPGSPRLARHGGRGRLLRPRRAQCQQGLHHRHDLEARSCSTTNRPSTRTCASPMLPSASSAYFHPRAPT